MKAGVTIRVQRVELLGSAPDPVPRKIYDTDGVEHPVVKMYLTDIKGGMAYDTRGRAFDVDKKGWITPHKDDAQNEQQH